jgi:hypothetical protein
MTQALKSLAAGLGGLHCGGTVSQNAGEVNCLSPLQQTSVVGFPSALEMMRRVDFSE